MRLKRAVTVVLLASLVLPAAALAQGSGIAPPPSETSSGDAIRDVYWIALAVAAVALIVVEVALVAFIVRFRRRRTTAADAEGPQIHGNTRLELAWTLVPALILAGLAAVALVKVNDVEATPSADENALLVEVTGHQFYFQYEYPNGAVSADVLYLPVDRPVTLSLESADVVHNWWAPALTGKRDMIPGRTNTLNFEPRSTGTYEGKCAEHCGIQHAFMRTRVEVLPQQEFADWLAANSPENADPLELGEELWTAACAKCHLEDGSGLVGPAVQGSGSMLQLESLRTLLLEGQDTPDLEHYMPAVGTGWQDRMFEALLEYIQSREDLANPPDVEPAEGGETDGD